MLSKNKIKQINSLQLKKNRKKQGLFIAEGIKTINDILESDFIIEELYYTREVESHLKNFHKTQHFLTDFSEMKKISQLKTPPGVIALVQIPLVKLDIEKLKEKLTIVLDDIQDPGNLGTIIRIANWFGIEDIICSENSVDVYNPKVIQATMGSLSGVKVHYANLLKIIHEAQQTGISVYGTFLEGENLYSCKKLQNGFIVLGNESNGISKEVTQLIKNKLTIPSFKSAKTKTESLNIAIATSLVCAEFRRPYLKKEH